MIAQPETIQAAQEANRKTRSAGWQFRDQVLQDLLTDSANAGYWVSVVAKKHGLNERNHLRHVGVAHVIN